MNIQFSIFYGKKSRLKLSTFAPYHVKNTILHSKWTLLKSLRSITNLAHDFKSPFLVIEITTYFKAFRWNVLFHRKERGHWFSINQKKDDLCLQLLYLNYLFQFLKHSLPDAVSIYSKEYFETKLIRFSKLQMLLYFLG